MRTVVALTIISLFAAQTVQAQKLVDPAKVAPEYREAAEKRRAEQLRQRACMQKAIADKVLPRDRTAYLNRCLESEVAKQ